MSTEVSGSFEHGDEIGIRQLVAAVWKDRWLVLGATILSVCIGVAYALLAPVWFRADVTLAPVGKQGVSGGLAQLGGLAALAGLSLPGSEGGQPVAVLKSKSLVREFIVEQDLLPELFADKWSQDAKRWTVSGDRQPDIRDGVKYFDEVVRTVGEDKKSGIVTLSIRWHDPGMAAEWANLLVQRVNERLRAQAIREAQTSIDYLQKEMLATSVVSLQQSIGRVLEGQMQTMALARANSEFAFKVVDPAVAPRRRESPKRALIAIASVVLGGFFGLLLVYIRSIFTQK
jgi:uncharacterized protein involved in exopolysaccharide biosynthesis